MKMKNLKTKSFGLILMSTLILLSLSNVSLAAVPSWVGVDENEQHAWTVSMHGKGMIAIAKDMPNRDLPFNDSITEAVERLTLSLNLYGKITEITEETTMDFNGTSLYHVNLTAVGWFQVPVININTSAPEPVIITILNPNNTEFSYFTSWLLFVAMSAMCGGGVNETEHAGGNENLALSLLVIPKTGIDWPTVVAELNDYLDKVNSTSGALVATQDGNGVKVTIQPYTLNESQSKVVELTAKYDSDGLLSSATMSYGGDLALSITYGATNIPGYEIAIVIGITAISTIGLIHAVKRKRKILLN